MCWITWNKSLSKKRPILYVISMSNTGIILGTCSANHEDVVKWKHFPHYWPFAQRPVTRSFDVFFDLRLNNDWVNNREAGDLRRHRAHYGVIVMCEKTPQSNASSHWLKSYTEWSLKYASLGPPSKALFAYDTFCNIETRQVLIYKKAIQVTKVPAGLLLHWFSQHTAGFPKEAYVSPLGKEGHVQYILQTMHTGFCLWFLPEASFGLRVLSLPASVCVCLSVCLSITCLSAR